MTPLVVAVTRDGWAVTQSDLPEKLLGRLRETAFAPDCAGTRCLLDDSTVQTTVDGLRRRLHALGVLSPTAVAVQAIAFDKTLAANWKVTWHQDVLFPLAGPATAPGYDQHSVKDRVHYARPPRDVLETLLAVRLHLDDCDATNGPLRVAPGSHRQGVWRSTDLVAAAKRCGEEVCLARAGEALLMRPLLLHASSPARVPRHRRVLHVVFHDGPAPLEAWHRTV